MPEYETYYADHHDQKKKTKENPRIFNAAKHIRRQGGFIAEAPEGALADFGQMTFARPWRLPTSQIPLVLKSGRRARRNFLTVAVREHRSHTQRGPRVAVIVSKKTAKKAVLRNRLRRRLTEAAKLAWPQGTTTDVVIVLNTLPRPLPKSTEFASILKSVRLA